MVCVVKLFAVLIEGTCSREDQAKAIAMIYQWLSSPSTLQKIQMRLHPNEQDVVREFGGIRALLKVMSDGWPKA